MVETGSVYEPERHVRDATLALEFHIYGRAPVQAEGGSPATHCTSALAIAIGASPSAPTRTCTRRCCSVGRTNRDFSATASSAATPCVANTAIMRMPATCPTPWLPVAETICWGAVRGTGCGLPTEAD